MAERRPVIPENQLLDLIKNPSKAQGLAQNQAVKRSLRSFFSPAAFKGRFLFFSEGIKSRGRKNLFNLKIFNRLLNLLIVVLFVLLAAQFVFFMRRVGHIPDFTAGLSKTSLHSQEENTAHPDMSGYLDKPHLRDIFRFQAEQAAVQEESPVVEESDDESYADGESSPLDHLILVGIGFSDDPDVMIKNGNSQEIYFLKRGDWIDGDIKVQAILRDRVILSYKGKEIELQ